VKKIILLSALLLTAACATPRLNIQAGDTLSAQKIGSIKVGETTMQQVLETFGQPMDRLLFASGESFYYRDFNLRSLYIEFNGSGVVSSYEADTSNMHMPSMPFSR